MLERYKSEKEAPVRDYLHVVMHCVFRHMFMDPTLDRPVWDLACDIAVENMITELGLKSTEARRQAAQEKEIEKLKKLLAVSRPKSYITISNRRAFPPPRWRSCVTCFTPITTRSGI